MFAFQATPPTAHQRGTKSTPIIGKDKEKHTNGMLIATKSGIFYPMQLIYHGKAIHCLPREIEVLNGLSACFTKEH